MNWLDLIIKLAAVLTALGVIIATAIKVFNTVNKVKEAVDNLNKNIVDLKKHSDENYMSLLRLTIMSNEMPIGERVVAGYKYLNNGGNGDVKRFLKEKFNIDDTVDEASHYKQ